MNKPGLTISHIFFADDTLIFLRAKEENCRKLSQVIDDYCLASGQKVNKSKSSVFFGNNVPESLSFHLTNILSMERVGDPGVHLGVPAIWGCSKKSGLAYVKERLLGKLRGWKKAALSQVGREVLIKAVAQAIPAYPMNLFKFPTSLCNELDAMISKFWWGQKDGEQRIHWVSREKLGWAKDMGGLGLRSFKVFNYALLAKQCWRLIEEPNSLWGLVLKARYFPNCSFMDAKRGGRASWAWSSLLTGRDILRNGAHWQIMSGNEVKVWVDRWIPSIPMRRPSPSGTVQVSNNLVVNSLICSENRMWDIDFLKPFLERSEFDVILKTHIGDPLLRDRLVWPLDKKRVYSVKFGYKWVVGRNLPHGGINIGSSVTIPAHLWKCVWKLEASPKIRCFLWKTFQEAVATMANLFRRRSSPSRYARFVRIRMKELYIYFCNARGWRLFGSGEAWVILAISLLVSTFKEAQGGPYTTPPPRGLDQLVDVCWSPHCPGFVKINVDASWGSCDGQGFMGIVALDEEWRFLAASRSGVKATSVAMGEAMAILHGCMLGKRMGWNKIILETDSLESISCLRDMAKKGSWDAFPSLLDCVRLGKEFLDCRWSWVPRPANSAADHLASRSSREVCDHVWVNRPPSSLVHVLCNNGLPCPP
nr:uncharacterized protein LOC108173698 [Malus domestica]